MNWAVFQAQGKIQKQNYFRNVTKITLIFFVILKKLEDFSFVNFISFQRVILNYIIVLCKVIIILNIPIISFYIVFNIWFGSSTSAVTGLLSQLDSGIINLTHLSHFETYLICLVGLDSTGREFKRWRDAYVHQALCSKSACWYYRPLNVTCLFPLYSTLVRGGGLNLPSPTLQILSIAPPTPPPLSKRLKNEDNIFG